MALVMAGIANFEGWLGTLVDGSRALALEFDGTLINCQESRRESLGAFWLVPGRIEPSSIPPIELIQADSKDTSKIGVMREIVYSVGI